MASSSRPAATDQSADTPIQVARDGERLIPTTRRGRRTRAALIEAAREVFERDGFLDARTPDIAEQAGVSIGAFYTYFKDKEAVFAAIHEENIQEVHQPGLDLATKDTPLPELIEASIRVYLDAYRHDAALMRLFEQVATINDDFLELRRRRAQDFVARFSERINDLQQQGRADPELNPKVAAAALGSMVQRLGYLAFALNAWGDDLDFESVVQTVTRLWMNGLQIDSRQ